MHHPGPPQFVVTGDEVELAPRDPDPAATYEWSLAETPDESKVTLGDQPVEHLVPDVPGTYVARLTAPDGEHRLTVRALPGDLAPHGQHGSRSGMSGVSGVSGRSGSGFVSGKSGSARWGSGPSARPESDVEGEGGRPRLTLLPYVEDGYAIVEADVSPHPSGTEDEEDIDVEFLVDDRDDVDPDAVQREEKELRIPVEALSDPTRIHAVAIGASGYSVPDAVTFEQDGGSVVTHRPYDPPEWAEDSVIYEIYVRTFGESEEGSAFDTIVERLDYIESLGVDVLWLTPVLQNDHAPHGYNITDFLSIAEDLGTREDYERFIEAARDRGIKVLFDLICNHSARTHPHFQAAVSDKDSEYRDWYEWRTDTEPETYFDWEHIANFNFDHLPVRRHLLDVVDTWAPLVDGFRCDMAWAVPNGFWRELHDRVKAKDREFLLLDETIPYIADFQAGLFDMHFDSTTYAALQRVGNGEDADSVLHAIDERAEAGFPDHAGFMLYAENHDETRYIVECGRPAAKAAAGALFTLPGAPMVYAGQEFGQRGRRDNLAWGHEDEQLQDHVRALSAARHEQPALSAGSDLERISYEVEEGDQSRVTAYGRVGDDDAAVVVLNFGDEPATVTTGVGGSVDLVSGDSVGDESATETTVAVDSVVVLPASPDEL